jgi:hypothetical protein
MIAERDEPSARRLPISTLGVLPHRRSADTSSTLGQRSIFRTRNRLAPPDGTRQLNPLQPLQLPKKNEKIDPLAEAFLLMSCNRM